MLFSNTMGCKFSKSELPIYEERMRYIIREQIGVPSYSLAVPASEEIVPKMLSIGRFVVPFTL